MHKSLTMAAASLLSFFATFANTVAASGELQLSPPLKGLLQQEMREVSRGTQTLAVAIAGADWKTVHDTSARIHASYILSKRLTAAQRHELEQALPEGFRQLDAEFHARALKLARAAEARDHELAVFHFSRMLESCVVCHSSYAKARFPGFAGFTRPEHGH